MSTNEANFLTFLIATARAMIACGVGCFGDRKVFLSAIYECVDSHPFVDGVNLDAFKAWMVQAHRDRKVVLARADLVAAMDPEFVSASEIRVDGATFHFLVVEPA